MVGKLGFGLPELRVLRVPSRAAAAVWPCCPPGQAPFPCLMCWPCLSRVVVEMWEPDPAEV